MCQQQQNGKRTAHRAGNFEEAKSGIVNIENFEPEAIDIPYPSPRSIVQLNYDSGSSASDGNVSPDWLAELRGKW
ncbi:hypothetical protein N0V85_006201 [Neurospora sp. IMI 360204]|nr:hypothetical protein N0V85_006201 [Neurospora sp. IMI 360204]